jgi:hypothetical protein
LSSDCSISYFSPLCHRGNNAAGLRRSIR